MGPSGPVASAGWLYRCMTNWARLSHAYGSAEDLPSLLGLIESAPTPERWNDLWSALCHQGSVYSASFAALPWLTRTAGGPERGEAVNAVHLAGAIMAGADQPHEAGDVRAEHADDVATLLSSAKRFLRTAADQSEYVFLLEAVLSFEGVEGWSDALAWGLETGEWEISCGHCAAHLFVVVGEHGFFSCSGDYALSEGEAKKRPLRPADPARLDGVGCRLYDRARTDGRHEVATALTYVFGDGSCPECDSTFSVPDRISAEWSAA